MKIETDVSVTKRPPTTKSLAQAVDQGYFVRRTGPTSWAMGDYARFCEQNDLPLIEVRLAPSGRARHCFVGADLYSCTWGLGEHLQRRCRQLLLDNGALDRSYNMIIGWTTIAHYRTPVAVACSVAAQLAELLAEPMWHEPKEVAPFSSVHDLIDALDRALDAGDLVQTR